MLMSFFGSSECRIWLFVAVHTYQLDFLLISPNWFVFVCVEMHGQEASQQQGYTTHHLHWQQHHLHQCHGTFHHYLFYWHSLDSSINCSPIPSLSHHWAKTSPKAESVLGWAHLTGWPHAEAPCCFGCSPLSLLSTQFPSRPCGKAAEGQAVSRKWHVDFASRLSRVPNRVFTPTSSLKLISVCVCVLFSVCERCCMCVCVCVCVCVWEP